MTKFLKYFIIVAILFSVITHSYAAERHWVGNGSGAGSRWDRSNNWSTTQNGAGGVGVPTATDTVYIDGGSGDLGINAAALCFSFRHLSAARTTTFTAGNSLTVGTGGVILGAGTFNVTNAASFSNQGNWTASGGTFIPGTVSVLLNGSANQTITGSTTFNNLTVNNSAGITLAANNTINGTLTLTAGAVTTGANILIVSSTGSISRTNGFVFGYLQKNVATGATTRTFEVGSGTVYSPASVSFGSVSKAGNLTVSAITGDQHRLSIQQRV